MSYKTYTLGNNSVIKWRQSIDGYYKKGLAEFSDATTVRTMLNLCDDYLSKDGAMIASVLSAAGQGEAEEFAAIFAEERVAMDGIRGELEVWLEERGLVR